MRKLKHIHPIKRWKSLDVTYKVGAVLLVVILVVVGSFAWGKYQDAQNEQFLRDIVADFDSLRTQLEQELNVEVENKSGCFTTSEKFGDGKTGCFVRLESSKNDIDIDTFAYFEQLQAFETFSNFQEFRSGGFDFAYISTECKTGFSELGFYIECPATVRGANNELVKELF